MSENLVEKDEIWPLLRRNTDFLPHHLSLTEQIGARYQVFEVLVTWILSEKNRDFHWIVTRVQGDGGIDFIGRRALLTIRGQESLAPEFAIIGQCKVRDQLRSLKKRSDDAFSQLERDFRASLKEWEQTAAGRVVPKLMVGCLADRLEPASRATSERELSRLCDASVTILDIDDISLLIADRIDLLDEITCATAFTGEERDRLRVYFSNLGDDGDRCNVRVSATLSNPHPKTGEIVRVDINVAGDRVLPSPLRARHKLDDAGSIEPLGAGRHLSYVFTLDDEDLRRASATMALRSFGVGQQSLGTLELDVGGHNHVICDLGEVVVEYSFRHHFFSWPAQKKISDDLVNAVRSHAAGSPCLLLGLVGPGGSGKSRLIEEISLIPEFDAWRFVTIRQSKQGDRPLGLIIDLICFVTTGRPHYSAPDHDAILKKLALFSVGAGSAARASFRALTESGQHVYDEGSLAVAVAALLRESTRHKSLLLHLSDMHRAPSDVLSFVARIASLIASDVSGDAGTVAIIVEGRDRSERDVVNRSFEYQLRSHALVTLDMPTLGDDTEAFLDHIISRAQNPKFALDPRKTASFESLRSRIAESCGGNPMFVVETLRLLIDLGYLRPDPRTGLLYLLRAIGQDLDLPTSVEECLGRRIDVVRDDDPALADTLCACGLLDDGIAKDLFQSICRHFGTEESAARLVSMGALVIEADGEACQQVSFSHEFYYQTAHKYLQDLTTDDDLVEIYNHHTQEKPETPQRLFDEARLAELGSSPRHAHAEGLFKMSLAQAGKLEQGALEYRIAWHLARLWRTHDPADQAPLFNIDISLRYAELILRYGDRGRALDWLSRLAARLDGPIDVLASAAKSQNVDPFYLKARVLVGLGNAMLNHLIAYQAVQYLQKAVAIIDQRMPPEIRDIRDTQRDFWLGLKVNAYDRLACALRIDGDLDGARAAATTALSEGRRIGRGLDALHSVSDYARLVALTDPPGAMPFYSEARRLLPSVPFDATRHDRMIEVSELSTRLQAASTPEDAATLADQAARMADDLAFSGYGMEMGAVLLNLSAALAFIDPARSLTYAEDAINWNMDRNYLEMLWKSHHNACIAARETSQPGLMNYHARRCYDLLIVQDLQCRPEAYRRQRMARYEPTLRLLSNGLSDLEPSISAATDAFCTLSPSWKSVPYDAYVRSLAKRRPAVEITFTARDVLCTF